MPPKESKNVTEKDEAAAPPPPIKAAPVEPVLTQFTIEMGFTIPTGEYANITPKVTATYIVPAGEPIAPAKMIFIMDDLKAAVIAGVDPLIRAQIANISIKSVVAKYKAKKEPDTVDETLMHDEVERLLVTSPMFRWLRTADASVANDMVREAIAQERNDAY